VTWRASALAAAAALAVACSASPGFDPDAVSRRAEALKQGFARLGLR